MNYAIGIYVCTGGALRISGSGKKSVEAAGQVSGSRPIAGDDWE
ncbi:hypothetical protein [Blastomonas sp.]